MTVEPEERHYCRSCHRSVSVTDDGTAAPHSVAYTMLELNVSGPPRPVRRERPCPGGRVLGNDDYIRLALNYIRNVYPPRPGRARMTPWNL